MKKNMIALYPYRDAEPFDFTAYNRRAETRFRSSMVRFWLSTVLDTLCTVAITGCTVFCCYLAFTML